jgi:adenylate kinase
MHVIALDSTVNYKVIYLTGAPASGKSSLTRRLTKLVDPLAIFEYGTRLTEYVNRNRGDSLDQSKLREKSSSLVSPADVEAVDAELIDFVARERVRSHVIIDSHAVTKESFGYRVTAYSLDRFALLEPTQIWTLYTSPEIAIDRISNDAQGRPAISIEEARLHTHLQSTVAIAYGMKLGVPVYFFDASRKLEDLSTDLAARLNR